MIIPFFTSYLVRLYSWLIFLADNGLIHAVFGMVGIGPLGMLNSSFGKMLGYMTLTFSLVDLLKLYRLMSVDPTLIDATHHLLSGRLRTIIDVVVPHAREGHPSDERGIGNQ